MKRQVRILSLRELNRATLARQFLLRRTPRRAPEVIRHLVAMQGQVSNAPYVGLWSRLQRFDRKTLTRLQEGRRMLRAPFLRGTLHLTSAEDYVELHPLLGAALSRQLSLFTERSPGFSVRRYESALSAWLKKTPRTAVELRQKMEELRPGTGGDLRFLDSVRMHMGIIQVPPAGVWGFTGRPPHAQAAHWLGTPLKASPADRNGTLERLVLRYLGAFGPASVMDAQEWTGLTKLGPVFEALAPRLVHLRDEAGGDLFDLPGAPRPPASLAAPVRFLPDFDNLLFGHADRRRIIADAHRPLFFSGATCAALLVDGFAVGKWKTRGTALQITLFQPLHSRWKPEIEKEGTRLLEWALDGARTGFRIEYAKP